MRGTEKAGNLSLRDQVTTFSFLGSTVCIPVGSSGPRGGFGSSLTISMLFICLAQISPGDVVMFV